jgi:shikimate dehydrogenase
LHRFRSGFRRALANVKLERVVQLGAGGAGAAVARAATVELGIRQLTIFDVDPAKAMQLAASSGRRRDTGKTCPPRWRRRTG